MRIADLIGGPVATCTTDTPLLDAARRMLDDDIGSLAVVADDRLVGIVTERDLVRGFVEPDRGNRVGDVMTPNPDSLSPEIDTADAADWMMGAGYRHLPVLEEGRLVGMVSIKDLLWAVTDRG
ncbi:MAG: CBS domain-containing protein [Acidimicrobiia bacterium]|nr:CBS domain-containing protein [Acidimicrobiia bacterium]